MKPTLNVAFTDFWHAETEEEIRKNHLFVLLSRRYDLRLSERPDVVFFSCFGNRFFEHDCLRIFYTGENFRPDLGVCDFAISFDYIDDPRHYRLPFYVLSPGISALEEAEAAKRDPAAVLSSKTKFCNFVYSNPRCKPRNDFFRLLSTYKRVDSAGKFLNNVGMGLGDTHAQLVAEEVPASAWSDDVKIRFQRQYKFTIAFENSSRPGYTTEKLVDAMLANTVPIYWGDPEVGRDLDTRSFINCHDFSSLEEVAERVKALDEDDDLYLEYLAAPYLTEYGRSTSLNEDRFFAWLDAAIEAEAGTDRRRPGPKSLSARLYELKRRHWFARKFGRLSHIWALYKRI